MKVGWAQCKNHWTEFHCAGAQPGPASRRKIESLPQINHNGVLILTHLSAGLTLSPIPSVLGGVHAAFKPGSLQGELLCCRKCPSKVCSSPYRATGGVSMSSSLAMEQEFSRPSPAKNTEQLNWALQLQCICTPQAFILKLFDIL